MLSLSSPAVLVISRHTVLVIFSCSCHIPGLSFSSTSLVLSYSPCHLLSDNPPRPPPSQHSVSISLSSRQPPIKWQYRDIFSQRVAPTPSSKRHTSSLSASDKTPYHGTCVDTIHTLSMGAKIPPLNLQQPARQICALNNPHLSIWIHFL
jgi:hypothetical protein